MKLNRVLPLLAAAVLSMGAARAPAADPDGVDYRLSPVFEGGELTALQVTLRFRADADGQTVLQLPNEWASEKALYRYVRDLRISGATGYELAVDGGKPDFSKRLLTSAARAPITVSYRVVTGFDADPEPGPGNPFKPIIRPQWFFVYGEALFAAPADRDSAHASFHWSGAPRGFGFASDLEHLARLRPGSVGDVIESIVIGGKDLRIYSRQVGGAPLRVAILGQYRFTDQDFAAMAERVLGAENSFWGGHIDPFLIAMAPLKAKENNQSLGGTGRSDAFALTASTDAELQQFRFLLAHEYFHTWDPRQLGGMYDGAREPAAYWFSEGFTDFYTRRLMLRAGVFSLEDFAGEWNDMLKAYDASTARNHTNEQIVTDFWTDYPTQKLPYQRGAMLAAIWNARLLQATGGRVSLDDVMHRMRDLTAADRDAGRERVVTADLFPRIYAEMGGPDLRPDIDRYIVRGETILLPADLWGDCARVETVTRAAFARGWDAEATTAAGNVVTGLKDDSPAYRAGIRNGMKIVKREFGEPGDSTVEYGLRIKAPDGTETVYRFMPVGTGPDETVQKVVVAPGLDAAKRAACARTVGGG